MAWTPRRANPEEHHVLVDGIPDWMVGSIGSWVMSYLIASDLILGQQHWNIPLLRQYDLDNHTTLADQLAVLGPQRLYQTLEDEDILDLLDWLMAYNASNNRFSANTELEKILVRGGSKWKVGCRNDFYGLEERLPSGVQQAAEEVVATTGDAGELLAEAWRKAFARDRDPQGAYNAAVKAVEAAAVPRVTPNDRLATLSKVISSVESQGTWKLNLSRATSMNTSSGEVVVSMMKVLWQGQQRHAGQSDHAPNTQDDAEAAILLATPLVQWFTSEAFARWI